MHQDEGPGKYILLISVHGLIRGRDLELGRDADTGGQTKYVVDLARALGQRTEVARVDLVTRRVIGPGVSLDYSRPIEELSDKAQIVRIECGPEEYIQKEQLWDHLDSFTDNLARWLGEQARYPDLVHSHYADAGYVGLRIANLLGIPLFHTGHSLGRDKRKQLLAKGMSSAQIESTYNMARRIDAEEDVLANADLVITSTHNEIEQQYGLYNYYDPERMSVIPPGTDLQLFRPYQEGERIAFEAEVERFLRDPSKPQILALSRPDERKNIATLIEAYGESSDLQKAANLVIVAGTRDDIAEMESGAQAVLTEILLLIDRYDLYGCVAVPKCHRAEEVPEIYRLAAASRGVFVNVALTEPFGLTILEAAASGLPVVATEVGGPADILANCRNGLLVDPLDRERIAEALLELLGDSDVWADAAKNGIAGARRHYSWDAHADRYMVELRGLEGYQRIVPSELPAPRSVRYRDRALFSDLDQSLLGDAKGLRLFADCIQANRKRLTFGIATGRRIDSALALIRRQGIPMPDVLISSLGTRIHYGRDLHEDDYWVEHIDHDWKPQRVRRLLSDLPGLKPQPRDHQSRFKISSYWDGEHAPRVEEIVDLLRTKELNVNVILSFGQYLDVIPARASKGMALRYVAQRLELPLEQVLVAGGSGADDDMMRGNTLAVLVANRYDEELSQLVDLERVYRADEPHALGILEAIEHYGFLESEIRLKQ